MKYAFCYLLEKIIDELGAPQEGLPDNNNYLSFSHGPWRDTLHEVEQDRSLFNRDRGTFLKMDDCRNRQLAMVLRINQRVMLYSPDLMESQKIPAVIHEIKTDHIVLNIPIDGLSIAKDMNFIIEFGDEKASYGSPSRTLIGKEPGGNFLWVSRLTVLAKKLKRVYVRVDINTEGEIWKEGNRETQLCLIKDLSAGGARITAQSVFAVQDPVLMDVTTAEKIFVGLTGRTVWKNDVQGQPGISEYGIQFENISLIRRNEVDAFIMKNAKMV